MEANPIRQTPATSAGPGPIEAASAHRRLVIGIAVTFAVIGFAVGRFRPDAFLAEASVVLEDPAASDVLSAVPSSSSQRRVLNQLEVFRSNIVANRAATIAQEAGVEITQQDILEDTIITSLEDTDQITVAYSASDAETAVTVASAVVEAYQAVRQEQREAEIETVVARLDSARQVVEEDLVAIQSEIASFRSQRGINERLASVLDRIVDIEARLTVVNTPEAAAALQDDLQQAGLELDVLVQASAVETEEGVFSALLDSEQQQLAQLERLDTRRSEVEVQARTEGTGIAFEDPAAIASTEEGAGALFTSAAAGFLGLLIGVGVAYNRASRRKKYANRFEPAAETSLHLLADIPMFDSDVPIQIRDQPRSSAAEAMRFALSNIRLALERADKNSLMFAASSVGEGKTTLLVNLALAAGQSGMRVLVLDADFGNQAATGLLLGELPTTPGLTEIAAGSATLDDAVTYVATGPDSGIEVLGRGLLPVLAPEFFASRKLSATIDRIASAYDLVLIDGPPFLQVAYASDLALLAGTTVVVLAHGSDVARSRELTQRLEFIGARPIGYLYNKAPVRRDAEASGGSMRDVLGDRGLGAEVDPRARGRSGQ